MSRPESKNSAISFDSDSDGSDDDAIAPSPVSPILTPTPSLAEKLKKANADLLQGRVQIFNVLTLVFSFLLLTILAALH